MVKTVFFPKNPVFYSEVKNENHLRVKCVKHKLLTMIQVRV